MQTQYGKLLSLLLCLLTILPLTTTVYAKTAEEIGKEIISRSVAQDDGFKDMVSDVVMILQEADGEQHTRHLRVKTLEMQNDGEKRLFAFDKPRDIKGTSVLNYGHILEDDDQWIYLPAFKRVKRISSSNKSGAFVSSEFAYEDLTSFEVDKYRHRYLQDVKIDGLDCFEVELIPAYENSGYSYSIVYIDKQDYLIRKIEFYDTDKKPLKTLGIEGYQRYKEQYWRPDTTTMTNLQNGKVTIMQWNNIRLQTGLTKSDFDRNALKRNR